MLKNMDQLSRRLHQLFAPGCDAGGEPLLLESRMTKYRVANHLSDTEAAYIAGLVDGEGSITLTRKHRNENRQLGLTISSTELPLLEFVLNAAGVGKITNKKTTKSHHTHSYAYGVYNRQALQVLQQIYSQLVSYKSARC